MRTCELRVDTVIGDGMSRTVQARLHVDDQAHLAVVFRIDSLSLMLTADHDDAEMLGWMITEGSTRLMNEAQFSGFDSLPNPTVVVPKPARARQLRQDDQRRTLTSDLSPGALLGHFEAE